MDEIEDSERTDDEEPRDSRQGIQSVEVAMSILESLAAGGGPMTLSEVAAGAGLRPNKVHRYMVSFIRTGFAAQSQLTGRYELGAALRRIGAEALRQTNEIAIASEHAAALRDATGHTVHISVWGDNGPQIVRWDYGYFAIPLLVRVGSYLSLLGSASGRVFLSYLPTAMTADALQAAQQTRREPLTSDQVDHLKESVRAAGFAVADGSLIPGAYAISVPIFTASDMLPFAMTVVFPHERVDDGVLEEVTRELLETSARLSRELGGAPDA